jgi:hypothetical protein
MTRSGRGRAREERRRLSRRSRRGPHILLTDDPYAHKLWAVEPSTVDLVWTAVASPTASVSMEDAFPRMEGEASRPGRDGH